MTCSLSLSISYSFYYIVKVDSTRKKQSRLRRETTSWLKPLTFIIVFVLFLQLFLQLALVVELSIDSSEIAFALVEVLVERIIIPSSFLLFLICGQFGV